jgi:threonine/homoserine/homoserine lactone efflux protein
VVPGQPQSSEPGSGQSRSGQARSSAPAAFRTGLTTNLLNPKVGVFYLSVMPQFLPASANPLAGSLALGAIHVVEGLVWLSLVVLAVNRARGWLTRPTVKRRLEQLTGLAFLGFGLRLALSPIYANRPSVKYAGHPKIVACPLNLLGSTARDPTNAVELR